MVYFDYLILRYTHTLNTCRHPSILSQTKTSPPQHPSRLVPPPFHSSFYRYFNFDARQQLNIHIVELGGGRDRSEEVLETRRPPKMSFQQFHSSISKPRGKSNVGRSSNNWLRVSLVDPGKNNMDRLIDWTRLILSSSTMYGVLYTAICPLFLQDQSSNINLGSLQSFDACD